MVARWRRDQRSSITMGSHEQEMSEIELAAARMRREVTDTQLEKARLGLLGVDYDEISGLAMDE